MSVVGRFQTENSTSIKRRFVKVCFADGVSSRLSRQLNPQQLSSQSEEEDKWRSFVSLFGDFYFRGRVFTVQAFVLASINWFN
jgi:hypothetical protein